MFVSAAVMVRLAAAAVETLVGSGFIIVRLMMTVTLSITGAASAFTISRYVRRVLLMTMVSLFV